jgi:hypothetical protein
MNWMMIWTFLVGQQRMSAILSPALSLETKMQRLCHVERMMTTKTMSLMRGWIASDVARKKICRWLDDVNWVARVCMHRHCDRSDYSVDRSIAFF